MGPKRCHGCGQLGHWIRDSPKIAKPLGGGPPKEQVLRQERQEREVLQLWKEGACGDEVPRSGFVLWRWQPIWFEQRSWQAGARNLSEMSSGRPLCH